VPTNKPAASRFVTVQGEGQDRGQPGAAHIEALIELVALVAAGRLEIPIAKVYPLSEVQEAYRELELRHVHGKIVLIP
jgi:NADPH:quinone reductase-like Zn-dependent oxidoreductase